jgi:uncharacterized protein
MNDARREPPRPWYRERWPWLLMLPPAASVIVGLGMLYLAIVEPNPLVVADYSNIEEINDEQFARDREAAAIGVTADLTFAPAPNGRVSIGVALGGPKDFVPPRTLALYLQHVARADADRQLTLERRGQHYAASTTLAAGRYDLELLPADASWRLAGPVPGVPGRAHLTAPGSRRN